MTKADLLAELEDYKDDQEIVLTYTDVKTGKFHNFELEGENETGTDGEILLRILSLDEDILELG